MDHWSSCSSDFGLESPKPPQMVTLYRYFYGAINDQDEQKAVYLALEQYSQVISKLTQDLEESKREAALAKQQALVVLEEKTPAIPRNLTTNTLKGSGIKREDDQPSIVKAVDEKSLEAQRLAQATAELTAKEQVKKKIPKRTRDYTFLFTRDETEVDDGARRIGAEVVKMKNNSGDYKCLVHLIGDVLPYLIPGVILKKREELIPLIVAGIHWHPDDKKRSELTYMLTNLIKVPSLQQRRVIIDGCVNLASLIGAERLGNELFPQAVELINSPNEERRVLAAEICGWLSPNVQHEMRISLLLSMLVSLAHDRSATVRTAVAVNLSRLLVLEDKEKDALYHTATSNEPNQLTISNTPSSNEKTSSNLTPISIDPVKFQQLCDMILAFLQDPDPDVLQVARITLIPIFGEFLDRLQIFEYKYLPSILAKMSKILKTGNGNPDSKFSSEWDIHAELLVYLAPTLYENCYW